MPLHLHLGSALEEEADIMPTMAMLQQRDQSTAHVFGASHLRQLPQTRTVVHIYAGDTDARLAAICAEAVDAQPLLTVHLYGRAWPFLCALICRADTVEKVDKDAAATPVTLCVGCMFAGKSSEAIRTARRLRRVAAAHTLVISHEMDARYAVNGVVSHDLEQTPATKTAKLMDLVTTPLFRSASFVVVEEAQFFPDLRVFVERCVLEGKRVFIYGLDGTAKREPFGDVCAIASLATRVTKLHAMCQLCPALEPAAFTHCMQPLPEDGVLVGSADVYVPLCRAHWLGLNQT